MIVTFFQVKMTMDGGDTKAQFTLEISVFKDKDYLLPHGIKEFPLRVSLSKPLYVQVKCAMARRPHHCGLVSSTPDRAVLVRALAREHCVVFLGKTLKVIPQK